MELGRSLQQGYQKNQRTFWQRVRLSTRGGQEMGRVSDEDGQIIGDLEELGRDGRDTLKVCSEVRGRGT